MGPNFRPTVAEINLDAIVRNFHTLTAHTPARSRVLAAVKANAYGHGAPQVARALAAAGCDWFGVATVEEGLELRRGGIDQPILLLSGAGRSGMRASVANDLTNVVYDVATALLLNEIAARQQRIVPIHIKVDTGMGRLGVMPSEWALFLDAIETCTSLHVDGVLTHFAHADASPERTQSQVALFEAAVDAVHARGWKPTFIHADNSAGVLGFDHRYNMARPGISLYGPAPGPTFEPLEAAMTLRTQVKFSKHIPAGTSVSYAGTWTSDRPTQLAVLPIGYADGYPRVLGGRAHVLVHGQRAPIRGRVCMDLTMVDVTDIQGDVDEGTPVVLIGEQGGARIDVTELADLAGTISYEILAGLTSRVPRTWGMP